VQPKSNKGDNRFKTESSNFKISEIGPNYVETEKMDTIEAQKRECK
jgi:hypothetical protein